MLVSGYGHDGSGLGFAEVPFLFTIKVRGTIDTQRYAFLQYMEAIRPVDTVDSTLG